MAFIDVAQLFLNGFHLLIQIVLTLTALHLLLDAATDALLNLQEVYLSIKQGQHMFDTSWQIGDFENRLLLLDLERHVRGHGVNQPRRLIDACKRGKHL